MKSTPYVLLALVLTCSLSFAWRSFGQCAGGLCVQDVGGVLAGHVIGQAKPPYEWRAVPDAPEQVALYKHGVQLGNYFPATGFYYDLAAGKRGGPRIAPVPPPFVSPPEGTESTPFGVTPTPKDGREHFCLNGDEITRGELQTLLEGDKLADDSKAVHLTVISRDPATVKRAVDEYAAFASSNPRAGQVRFQAYAFGERVNQVMLAPYRLDIDQEFQRTGTVVIAQLPGDPKDGRSTPHRVYQYDGPGTWLQALRNVSPDWNPNAPKLPSIPSLAGLTELAWLAAACVVLLGLVLVAVVFH